VHAEAVARDLRYLTRGERGARGHFVDAGRQPGDEFFVILDGSAAVEKPGKKRAFLRPGDFFGG
jgi:uncharacterized cupin superfamily protein